MLAGLTNKEKNLTKQFSDDFIQYSDKKVKEETKHLTLYLSFSITLYIIILFFAIFFTWYTVFVSTHSYYAVSGSSMEPAYNNGSNDAVYVNQTDPLSVYDVVVIEKLPDEDSIIKRVIAKTGDYVSVAKATDGYFYVYKITAEQMAKIEVEPIADARLIEDSGANGYSIKGYDSWLNGPNIAVDTYYHKYEKAFYNTFLTDYDPASEDFYDYNGLIYVKVPENKFFCLGDNRGVSKDSREYGFFNKSQIVGRVEIVIHNHNFVNRIWEVVKFYFSEMQEFFAR